VQSSLRYGRWGMSPNKQLQAPFAALTSAYMARVREPRLQL
jgi:hypothetical protein